MTAAGVNIIGPEGHPSIDSPPELIVSVSGAFSVNTNHLGDFDRGDFTVRHVATKIAGNHEFRMGGEAVRVSNHLINTYQMAGRVAFNGQLSGDPMADFIFGRTSNFRQGGGEFKDLKGTRWGFFIQDNWRASQRLTVNLGLRWDPYLPPYDRQGRVICFQPGVQSQRYPNAPTGVLYGGASRDASCPVAGSEPAWSNFGPRIGLAYRLTDDGRTSLRVGAGYFYTPERTGATNGLSNTAPFGATFDTYDVDWAEPYLSAGLANPFPANFGPEVPGPEFVFAPETRIRNYPSLDLRIPQIFTYSVRLERQFANSWVVGLGYIANKGTYLRDTQEANPAIYIPGASTVGNTQERRLIFPTFGSVTRVESGANSVYQSLQFNAEKRFARGYSILTNYTWSKTMSSEYGQDFLDSRREASIDGDDIPHNFKFSNVWDVPQTQMTGLAGKILNGWQLNSIVVWQSGFPFGVSSGRDNSFNGSTDRAQFIGAGSAQLSYDRPHGEMIEQWFDTSKFAVNPIGAYGNSGRNILRGPRFFNTDFGLLKVTQLTERVGMQFRAEFFNVFNNVNFRLPNSTVTSSSFGKITQVVADNQRIIQFGLKLIF
jgi:hypothetical protein